jgi:hypothetical protein
MFTNIMKSVAIAALLLAALWRPSAGYGLMLQALIFMSALMVMLQAALSGRFLLASGFLVAAALFNPVVPVPASVLTSLWLNAACLMLFMFSVILSRSKPALSIPSITGRTPGSESL